MLRQALRLGGVLGLALSLACTGGLPAVAASVPTTCTGTLTIFTTSVGTLRSGGDVSIFRGSGVAGGYTSGPLAGATFVGSQDIVLNAATHQSDLHGSYVAVTADHLGTVLVRYVGHADLTTGQATGTFVASGGTGSLAGFKWAGDIQARLVSLTPPTFATTDSGVCVLP